MTRWLWTAADGTITELSAWGVGNHVTADGTVGQFAPAYEFATQAYAGVDGAALRQVTPQPRQPVLGIDLVASDGDELRQRLRDLAHRLRPRAGIGRLTAIGDDGRQRWLPCYYRAGIEQGRYVVNRFRAALEFWSPSPWWRGDPVDEAWSLAAPGPFFPILPIRLSATTIGGERTIDLSDTDAPTYPTWTVTGPGSQLTLRNESTGAELVLNSVIGDGQAVVIDTRPGEQSIRLATLAGTLTENRRNRVRNPQPATIDAWYSNNAAIAALALVPGGGAVEFTRAAGATQPNCAATGFFGALETGSVYRTVATPGETLHASAKVLTQAAGRQAHILITGWQAPSTGLGSTTGAWVPLTPGVETTVDVSGVIPAGATQVLVTVEVYSVSGAAIPAGEVTRVRHAYVSSAPGDYFDGDTPDTGDTVYAWTGAAHASESTQSTLNHELIYGASLFRDLASDPAMWPLVDGVNTVSALLTNAGPASSIALAADRLYSGAL